MVFFLVFLVFGIFFFSGHMHIYGFLNNRAKIIEGVVKKFIVREGDRQNY